MNVLVQFFESIPSAVQEGAQKISSTTNSLTSKITKKDENEGEKADGGADEKDKDNKDEATKPDGDTITGAEAWEKWERDHKVPYVSGRRP